MPTIFMNEEMPMITLTLDDDTVLDCNVIAIFPVEEKNYIALLPIDPNTNDEDFDADVLLYEFKELEDTNEVELNNIESDEEYEMVADAFDALIDSVEDDEDFDLDFE